MKDDKLDIKMSSHDVVSDNFLKLSPENQSKFLDCQTEQTKIEAGIFGKIFGTNPDNINRFVSFLISFILLILVLAYFIVEVFIKGNSFDGEVLSLIFPIFTLIIGYMFGHR